jgi:DNA-binding transcriptional regulator YiaG
MKRAVKRAVIRKSHLLRMKINNDEPSLVEKEKMRIELIKQRARLCYSMRELANIFGVHFSTISNWETGKRTISQQAYFVIKLLKTLKIC